ncbi:MAG: tetratricopeptide repeat protein, partial [Treponema sp.]|nr:tetratricopeptide repeat protein [Treponema sp.]
NGQYDKAIEALTKAYELDPNHGSTVKYLAYSYSRDILGKSSYSDSESTNAMDWIEKALSISDDDADLYLFRARLYGNAEDFDKAIADYNKALELAPGADFVKNEMEQTRKLQKQKEREAYLAQFPRLTARELTKAYEDNPKGTREKWQRGMTIIISGSVQDFSSFHWAFGEPQPPNVVLDGYNATSLVNCYFPYDGSIENIILHREAVIMGKIYGFGSSMSGNTVVQLHACSVVE